MKEPKEPCELCGKVICECNGEPPKKKVKVKLADGSYRSLQHMTKTRFWSKDGTPVLAEAFIKQLFGELPSLFKDEAKLREIWSKPDTRKKLLEELEEKGYSQAQLYDLQELVEGKDSDLFDVLSFVAYHRDLVPRSTRAGSAKIHFDSYDAKQQEFLNFVLEQYVQSGVNELDDKKLPELLELKYNALADAKAQLGSIASIRENFIGFQKWLYGEVG
jgi:type I restriction enzyme R subunit